MSAVPKEARTLIALAVIEESKAARASAATKQVYLDRAAGYRRQAEAAGASDPNAFAELLAETRKRMLPASSYSPQDTKQSATIKSFGRFNAMAQLVRGDLVAGGQIVQFDSCVRATLKFPLPCTDRNIEKYTYRDDVWLFCRTELARLLMVKPDPNKPEDRNPAYMLAWVEAVYSWCSLAFYAANVQPFMLFPEPGSVAATIGTGQCVPIRSGLPPRVFNVKSGIRDKLNAAQAKTIRSDDMTGFGGYWYGPTWKGFHARGIYTQRQIEDGANPWLLGDFGMDTRQLVEGQRQTGDTKYFGANYVLAKLRLDFSNGKVIETRQGLEAFFEYGANHMASTIPGHRWAAYSRNVSGDEATEVISPWGIVQLADAWAYDVVMVPMMEYVTNSFGWYAYNHLPFFSERGDLKTMSVDDIIAMQRGINAASIAVKEKKLDTAIVAISSVAAVIGAAVPGWGTLVAAIIIALAVATQFIAKAIFRKRAPKPQCPQPPVIRSLSDARCDIANMDAPLGELNAMNQRLLAAEVRESMTPGSKSEQSFGSGGFTVNPMHPKTISPSTIALGVGAILGLAYIMKKP